MTTILTNSNPLSSRDVHCVMKSVYKIGAMPSWVATTNGIDAGFDGDLMMELVEKRLRATGKQPKTIEWMTDKGSSYTAVETRSYAKKTRLKHVTTPVTGPQSNGMAESLVKT